MDPLLALLIGLAVGVLLGAIIGALVVRARAAGQTRADVDPALLEARHAQLVAELRSEEASARGEIEKQLAGSMAGLDALSAQLRGAQEQYRELVDRTRREAEERATAAQGESKVLQALTPVQETLRTMQAKVTELETQRTLQHGELTQQLRSSLESESHLRATAESLASALRGNSTRGAWGEAQLRRLVEAAGLLEHVDFTEQSSVASDVGAGRIDMVVHLSDGKDLAIDAKVPFDSFLKANEIPLTATGAEGDLRRRLLSEHVKAMRGHVDALAKREYWAGLATSPDLVIGFIPSESLLATALEHDPGLLDYAFRKNVALASPVTLWAVLKTVAYSWRQEAMSKDAKRIFDLSSELYSRLRVLADHSESLRRAIESTVSNYNKFASSLESRVLVTARRINENGDPSLQIAEASGIDATPKPITASDLIESEFDVLDVERPQLDLGLGLADPGVEPRSETKRA